MSHGDHSCRGIGLFHYCSEHRSCGNQRQYRKSKWLANPVTFGYTTAPTITNNQTDIAGVQTILASGVTLSSTAVAAANISQGTSNNIVYIVKME